MRIVLRKYRDRLRASFWFRPAIMICVAVAPSTGFAGIAGGALDQIRQAARPSAAVTIRLLDTIAVVATSTRRAADRVALRRHAEMIARGARAGLAEEEDRRTVEDRFLAASRVLGECG